MKMHAGLILGFALMAGACSAPAPETAPEAAAPEAAEPAPAETPDAATETDTAVQPEMNPIDTMDDTCGMAALETYVGQQASAIPEAEMPENTRVVGPDDQVTMDYVPTRLNVLTDAEGVVLSLKCG
ncbi:I78 family peptidase inhibitor [Hyphomonas chukchiensis]|uniref:Peptidase inhibitor I78 family protein n=1 Tax=Hyphomonas chukchiensis TaxID=1280947 RepID=A0A062UEQ1_9PROT|nr:I78 family peptidase inhibitor [Hyphomonas chukchiensis]KCZ56802.1 hypothetical protein HY30_06695 [Hyphomonas chukchiensis]